MNVLEWLAQLLKDWVRGMEVSLVGLIVRIALMLIVSFASAYFSYHRLGNRSEVIQCLSALFGASIGLFLPLPLYRISQDWRISVLGVSISTILLLPLFFPRYLSGKWERHSSIRKWLYLSIILTLLFNALLF